MSESSLEILPLGEPIYGVFVVYDSSNNPVTGLVQSGFTIFLSNDGTVSSDAVTISEVSSGRYVYSFTPSMPGEWYILITHATYNVRGWDDEFIVQVGGGTSSSTWPYMKDYLRRTREDLERRVRTMRKRKSLNQAAMLAIILASEEDD